MQREMAKFTIIFRDIKIIYPCIYTVRLGFFLFSSIKIDVKTEHTSDDRKQRRVCKASIVPSSFLSMTNNGGNKEEKEERRI